MNGIALVLLLFIFVVSYHLNRIADEIKKTRESNEEWRDYKEKVVYGHGQSTRKEY